MWLFPIFLLHLCYGIRTPQRALLITIPTSWLHLTIVQHLQKQIPLPVLRRRMLVLLTQLKIPPILIIFIPARVQLQFLSHLPWSVVIITHGLAHFEWPSSLKHDGVPHRFYSCPTNHRLTLLTLGALQHHNHVMVAQLFVSIHCSDVIYLDCTADIWSNLRDRFSQGDLLRITELQEEVYLLK